MKSSFAFFLILILAFSLFLPMRFIPVYVYAQEVSYASGYVYGITLSTDRAEYFFGESILVSGVVNSSETLPVKLDFHEYFKDKHEYAWSTAQKGFFSLSFKVSTVGYWRITAEVDVDTEVESVENRRSISNAVEVVVKYSSGPKAPAAPPPSTVGSLPGPGLPIGFAESADYFRLNFTMFIVEFYKGSAGYDKIYDKFGNVLVYDDRVVLEYSQASGKWKQRGTPTGVGYVKISDYHYEVTRYYTDYLGTTYNVTYTVKADSPMKISVSLQSGQNDTYRVAWYPSGITRLDYQYRQKENCVTFGDETADYGWISFDWTDVYQSFGNITETSVAAAAEGRKANVYFNVGAVKAGGTLTIDPSVVGTSTTSHATLYPNQRKTFHANGRFWVFYSDGANMVYATSTNGASWSSATTVRSCTDGSHFSVWFDGAYLHYAYADDGSIYYRRGAPNSDGTVTWDAAEQTVSTDYNAADNPFLSTDTNGYVWIGYREYTGTYHYPYIIKSGNNNGTWGTTPSGFPYRLSATSSSTWKTSVVPLTAGKMVAVYAYDEGTVYARRWSGSAWGDEKATASAVQYAQFRSEVVQGDDVHLTFSKSSTYDIIHTKYVYASDSFSSEVTVIAGASYAAPVLSVDSAGKLYCFWATKTTGTPPGATANHIYYQTSADGGATWSAMTDWVDESAEQLYLANRLTGFYMQRGSYIGLAYVTKTASPYNVKFAFLTLNAAPAIGQFEAPAAAYANKYFLVNATVNDADGAADLANATVEISSGVVLKWDNATDTFSEYSDAYGYCTLDTAGSFKTSLNSTAHKLSWKIKLSWNYPEGYVSVISTNTKVFDSGGLSGSNSYTNLFYFEDDLVVTSASVDDGRVNPGDTVNFNGTVYYEGTITPPASGSSGLSFDGENDYVEVPYSPTWQPENLTVMLWLYPKGWVDQVTGYNSHHIYPTGEGFGIVTTSLYWNWWITDSTGRRGRIFSHANRLNEWHHLVLTYDKALGDMKFYWNGELKDTYNLGAGTAIVWGPGVLKIGHGAGFDTYGLIDEVRIYNRALSASEIAQNYHATKYGNTTYVTDGLVLELTAASISGSTWKDTSGNRNDGTIYGATAGIIPKLEKDGTFIQTVGGFVRDDGTFTLERVTAPQAAGNYSYRLYAATDENSVQNQTANVAVDRIKLTSLGVSETKVPVKTQVLAWATAELDLDGHALGGEDNLTLNGCDFTWNPQLARFEYKISRDTPQKFTFDTLTNSSSPGSYEATYSIKVGTANGLAATVEWYSEEAGGGGGGGGGGGDVSPVVPTVPAPPVIGPVVPVESLQYGGIIAIVALVGFAYVYKQAEKKPRASRAHKQWMGNLKRSGRRKPKWSEKKHWD